MNPVIVSTFVVGVPSVIVALATYVFATRAHREAMSASKESVDSQAYGRARDLYEGSVRELRQGQDDLRTEIIRLHDQLDRAYEKIREQEHEMNSLRSRIWDLEHARPGESGND